MYCLTDQLPSDYKLHSFSIADHFTCLLSCTGVFYTSFFNKAILYVLLLSLSVPEIELKNAKGLSNEKINELKSRLAELAKQRCGEVRTLHLRNMLWS